MLLIFLLLAILVSVLSVTSESNEHKNRTVAVEVQMTPEHQERSLRSYQLIYPNQISQYPSSQLFGSGGYSNNLYYSPTQGRGAGFTDSRRSDISSVYRFLYPDQNQQVYSRRLPVQTWNTQSDTKVQAGTKESQTPIDESMTGEIKPTNRLLNTGQNQQELPVHIGRAQSETNLIVQARTKDSKKEFKEQQIKPTNRLLNISQNQQELPVHSGGAQSEKNLIVQARTKDSKKEFKEQQIKLTNRLLNISQNQQELPVHSGGAQSEKNLIVQASTKDLKKEFKEQQIKPTNLLLNTSQNQQELPVHSGGAQSETNLIVQAITKDSKKEFKEQQIKPTNRLLNISQNQQELPVHSSGAQSETNLIVQASTKDPKKEFKEQQIKPTNRLLNSDELSVQTGKFKSETNIQESAIDRTLKDESRIHLNKNKTNKSQIKNDKMKKQKNKLQPSENLKPKIISVINNLPKASSTLSENNSPTKVESSFLDQRPTTIKPQSSTANAILSAPTKKPFRKQHKKHLKDNNLIDKIFYSFFSSEEI